MSQSINQKIIDKANSLGFEKVGFSKAWDVFVQLGMTSDDSCKKIINSHKFSKYLKKLKTI